MYVWESVPQHVEVRGQLWGALLSFQLSMDFQTQAQANRLVWQVPSLKATSLVPQTFV